MQILLGASSSRAGAQTVKQRSAGRSRPQLLFQMHNGDGEREKGGNVAEMSLEQRAAETASLSAAQLCDVQAAAGRPHSSAFTAGDIFHANHQCYI